MFRGISFGIEGQPRSYLSRALIITRRELRDSARDWRILSPLLSLTFIVPALIVAGVRMGSGFLERLEAGTFENRVLPFATLAVGFFPMSFSLILALESFVGEKERNSLEALLSAPLTDLELFTGKFLAAVIPTVLSCVYGTVVFVSGILITGGPLPAQPIDIIFFLFLGSAKALVMVGGAVIVSSHATSVRGANLLASFVIVPMAIVIQIEAVIVISGQSTGLFFVLLGLIIIFIILVRTGVRVFNREELLSKEGGDSLKFGLILKNFGQIFSRTPYETIENRKTDLKKFSIWRLYRHDIPQIIRLNGPAVITVVMSIMIGIFLGWWISAQQPVKDLLNSYTGNIADNYTRPESSVCQPDFFARQGITWYYLFFNNARAVLIGSALGFFTLGIAGLVLLMASLAPLGVIGNLLNMAGANFILILVGFVLPHGILELPAAIIAIGAGLQVGTCFVLPPKGLSIGRSLQLALVNYVKLLPLVIPLLLVAAIIEANLTPIIGCSLVNK
jgi:uncharacterized membrane protein SpoIIM required for sporulation/ABC-type transport system involved in multi-copper enzyme maturation permease subunit